MVSITRCPPLLLSALTELQDVGYGSIENAKSKAAAFEKVSHNISSI